jgi:hypothetical protein
MTKHDLTDSNFSVKVEKEEHFSSPSGLYVGERNEDYCPTQEELDMARKFEEFILRYW